MILLWWRSSGTPTPPIVPPTPGGPKPKRIYVYDPYRKKTVLAEKAVTTGKKRVRPDPAVVVQVDVGTDIAVQVPVERSGDVVLALQSLGRIPLLARQQQVRSDIAQAIRKARNQARALDAILFILTAAEEL
jgi:hypothetical protein